jgi:hypothetical protein
LLLQAAVVIVVLVLSLVGAPARWALAQGVQVQWWSSCWCSPWWGRRLGERWLLLLSAVVIVVLGLSLLGASA